MDDRLMNKLLREERFYTKKNVQLRETLNEKKLEVFRLRENLERLKRDLRSSEKVLEALGNDGF